MKKIGVYCYENNNGLCDCYDMANPSTNLSGEEISKCLATYGKFNYYNNFLNEETDYIEICENGFYLVKENKSSDTDFFAEKKYFDYIADNIKDKDFVHLKNERLNGFKSNRDYIEHLIYDIDTIDLLSDIIKEGFDDFYKYFSEYMCSTDCYNLSVFIIKKTLLQEMMDFVFGALDAFEKKAVISEKYPKSKLNILEVYSDLLIKVFLFSKTKEKAIKEEEWLLTGKPYIRRKNFELAFPDENSVNVVFSSSDYFSAYLGVCLKSLINCANPDRKYDIVIMERGISEFNKSRILKMTANYDNISVRFYNIGRMFRSFNFFINSERISEETYYGLMVPHILTNYSKAVIMDCDMIVKQDVAELFDTSLDGYVAGGVRDAILQGWLNNRYNDTSEYYKSIGAKNPFTYVNGGLLFIDFEKYRNTVTVDMITEYINKNQFRVVDQDVFNLILEGKVKALDVKWNHMVYVEGAISQAISDSPYSVGLEYFEAKKNPGIIHYASENKPWNILDLEFADEFWDVARQTNFYEILLKRLLGVVSGNNPVVNIDNRSGARKIADFFFPKNSKRRNLLKSMLPKGSKRWRFLKEIYYLFRPELKIYRDVK